MSREIRQVPLNWQHPKDEEGSFKPLFNHTYFEGIVNHIKELPWYIKRLRYFKEWLEQWPDPQYYRPYWRKEDAVGYQIYEDVTEGTPISPVFATIKGVENWLIEQGHSKIAAKRFCEVRWVPSFTTIRTQEGVRIIKGIEQLAYRD